MNKKRLIAIAEWLEAGALHKTVTVDGQKNVPVNFEMSRGIGRDGSDAGNICGTTCCIAGAAIQFFNPEDFVSKIEKECVVGDPYFCEVDWGDVSNAGARLLGLSKSQANLLFSPSEMGDVDPAWAARTIRHFIKTGKVNWEITSWPDISDQVPHEV